MKSTYVSDLKPNQDATTIFLVQNKDIRQKKTGEPYLSLTLMDKSGAIDAKMWDNVGDVLDTFDRDDFVKAKGRAQVYQNKPQFTVHKLIRIEPAEVDFTDFFPASKRDPNEMFAELRQEISGIGNPHIQALLNALFDDEEIARRYRQAPAAKSVHHAYLGGLIEHVLSLCHLAKVAAEHYPFIDRDLLLAGVILHDIGKIYELSYERSFGYTDHGQLLGHITIGIRMVDDKIRDMPEFPARLRTLIEHMILSHHGELEFGSPKVPLFAEAILLHHLDNLDSKMDNVRASVERDRQVEGFWTTYIPSIERHVLKKDKYLENARTNPSSAPVPASKPESRQARPAHDPRTPSLFGEKLQQALGDER